MKDITHKNEKDIQKSNVSKIEEAIIFFKKIVDIQNFN